MSDHWPMPDWMRQFEVMISDAAGPGVEDTMNLYGRKAAALMGTEEGRAISVNAQVGLLVALHARGLLKDVPPCPLEPKHTVACPNCEKSFTATQALEAGMRCPCGGSIRSVIEEA